MPAENNEYAGMCTIANGVIATAWYTGQYKRNSVRVYGTGDCYPRGSLRAA